LEARTSHVPQLVVDQRQNRLQCLAIHISAMKKQFTYLLGWRWAHRVPRIPAEDHRRNGQIINERNGRFNLPYPADRQWVGLTDYLLLSSYLLAQRKIPACFVSQFGLIFRFIG
jgi:hypothetical protein